MTRTIPLLRLMADRRQRTIESMALSMGWTEKMTQATVKTLRKKLYLSIRKRRPVSFYSITNAGYERSFYTPKPRARAAKPMPVRATAIQMPNMRIVTRALSKQPDLVLAWRF